MFTGIIVFIIIVLLLIIIVLLAVMLNRQDSTAETDSLPEVTYEKGYSRGDFSTETCDYEGCYKAADGGVYYGSESYIRYYCTEHYEDMLEASDLLAKTYSGYKSSATDTIEIDDRWTVYLGDFPDEHCPDTSDGYCGKSATVMVYDGQYDSYLFYCIQHLKDKYYCEDVEEIQNLEEETEEETEESHYIAGNYSSHDCEIEGCYKSANGGMYTIQIGQTLIEEYYCKDHFEQLLEMTGNEASTSGDADDYFESTFEYKKADYSRYTCDYDGCYEPADGGAIIETYNKEGNTKTKHFCMRHYLVLTMTAE